MTIKTAIAIAFDMIAAPFRRPTVNSIVGQMEKQVDELFKVAADRVTKADSLRVKAEAIHDKADMHEEEAERALRVAERFTNLIR
ncbi:hypothetical protein [uncultured Xanthomonas sp.]|uniref:hypothetical protein n=1 Tax=uncultured Xanthomonas sp. TaxID=152831 RepID=UPI0025E2A6DF|nr:hypothetical protein [uncultured Xanthomonas sp.]